MSMEREVDVTIVACYGIYESAAHGSAWVCRRFGYIYGNGGVTVVCMDWGNQIIPCSVMGYEASDYNCTVRVLCRVPLKILETLPQYVATYACIVAQVYDYPGHSRFVALCKEFNPFLTTTPVISSEE